MAAAVAAGHDATARPAECADNRGDLKEEMWIWTM